MIKTGFQLNRRWAALAAGVLLIASAQLLMVNAANAADGDVTEYKLNNQESPFLSFHHSVSKEK